MADIDNNNPRFDEDEEEEQEMRRRHRLHEEEIERLLLEQEEEIVFRNGAAQDGDTEDDDDDDEDDDEDEAHDILLDRRDANDPNVDPAAAQRDNIQQQQQLQQQGRFNNIAPPPWYKKRSWSYLETSFYSAAGLLFYALRTRQQWYLALVFLSSSKLSLVVFGNALVALAIYCFHILTSTFLSGGLRLQEAEGLQDFFRWNVTETCLALTMFRNELKLQTAIEFLALIWIKCAHQVAVLRENHVRMTQEAIAPTAYTIPGTGGGHAITIPMIPWPHVKLWTLFLLLQWTDLWIVQYMSSDLITIGPSVNILFCFEAAILLTSAWSHLLLLYLHVLDAWLHFGHEQYRGNKAITRMLHLWKEYKATLTFAVELQAQAIQFLFYLSFFAIVLTYYGMPINLFREVYVSFTALKERLVAFLKYRRLMASMNRFPSATEEQLRVQNNNDASDNDATGDNAAAADNADHNNDDDDTQHEFQHCIICRDEMTPAEDVKILPVCLHLFHKSCLREWLVQQQSCPTCRSDIAKMEAQEAARAVANAAAAARAAVAEAAAAAQEEEQEQQAQEIGMPPPLVPGPARQQQQEEVVQPNRSLQTIRRLREQRDLQQQQQRTFLPSPPQAASGVDDAVGGGADGDDNDGSFQAITFPALYRVVQESGAHVLDDHGTLVRTVPPGRVLLASDTKQQITDGTGTSTLVQIPDGWVVEDAVVRVHTLQAW